MASRFKNLRRIKSELFEVALPEDNVFDGLCGGPGTLPTNVYSPAVDEVLCLLDPLDIGKHALHFHAENSSQGVIQDVTYNLTVVPVLEK